MTEFMDRVRSVAEFYSSGHPERVDGLVTIFLRWYTEGVETGLHHAKVKRELATPFDPFVAVPETCDKTHRLWYASNWQIVRCDGKVDLKRCKSCGFEREFNCESIELGGRVRV